MKQRQYFLYLKKQHSDKTILLSTLFLNYWLAHLFTTVRFFSYFAVKINRVGGISEKPARGAWKPPIGGMRRRLRVRTALLCRARFFWREIWKNNQRNLQFGVDETSCLLEMAATLVDMSCSDSVSESFSDWKDYLKKPVVWFWTDVSRSFPLAFRSQRRAKVERGMWRQKKGRNKQVQQHQY